MHKHAAIIGAGIGGLAAAIRLKILGFDVRVFESNKQAGGKISQFTRDGFRFDQGPTLFTLPSLVTELFHLSDRDPSNYFSYYALPEITRYFYEDGTCIKAPVGAKEFADELAGKTKDEPSSILRYLDHARQVYELTAPDFIFDTFGWTSIFSRSFWKAALQINKLNINKTLHQVHQSHFSDPKTIQLFDRYATYMGSDPYLAPGTLASIPHLEHNLGAYFPDRGMYRIVEALHNLASELGIDFRFSEPVLELEIRNRSVTSVQTGRNVYPADLAVSDVDISTLRNCMLPGEFSAHRPPRKDPSSSALVFYWGMKRTHSDLNLHNILFSADYRKEFDHIFNRKSISEDPTVYIFISCKAVPSDAPDGHENWYVMVNAPTDQQQDWPSLIDQTREAILRKIERITGFNVRDEILFEELWDPRSIASQTGSWRGALYGESFNSKWAPFRRPGNRFPSLNNLYLAGGTVHPGGGIPLSLSSAQIVESLIKSDFSC